MVSLFSLSEVTEEGVHFRSPYDGEETLLSPERSVEIQNALGKRGGFERHVWFGTSFSLDSFI